MYALESELSIRRAELSIVRSQIADRELKLITILESLIDFRSRYSSVLRDLYLRLDHINHEISKLTTSSDPLIQCVTQELSDAPEPVNIATTTNLVILVEPSTSRRRAKSDLVSLFRHAARKLHPDFASNEYERQQRCRAMAQVNDAYERGDIETIQMVLSQWTSDSKTIDSGARSRELDCIFRQLAISNKRLQQIERELAWIKNDQWYVLSQKERKLKARGKDLLVMLSRETEREILKAERILKSLRKHP